METWTPGTFLLALVGVVLAAAVLGSLLQRKVLKQQAPNDSTLWMRRVQTRKLRVAVGVLVGLLVASRFASPPDAGSGTSPATIFWLIVLAFGVLVSVVLIRRK